MKVCVVGAAGGIGQPLALLLKLCEAVNELSLYDVVPIVPGTQALVFRQVLQFNSRPMRF